MLMSVPQRRYGDLHKTSVGREGDFHRGGWVPFVASVIYIIERAAIQKVGLHAGRLGYGSADA